MVQNKAGTIKLHAGFILTSVTTVRSTTSGKMRLLILGLKRFSYILICVNNQYFNKWSN